MITAIILLLVQKKSSEFAFLLPFELNNKKPRDILKSFRSWCEDKTVLKPQQVVTEIGINFMIVQGDVIFYRDQERRKKSCRSQNKFRAKTRSSHNPFLS